MKLKVTTGHFKDKREAIQEISDAGWWPISWRDAPGEVSEGAVYIIGMPKVDLLAEYFNRMRDFKGLRHG